MGSWEYDVVNGRWTWDEGQARIFGIDQPATEFTIAALQPAIHPDDLRGLTEMVDTLSPDSSTRQAEIRIVRPGGEERTCAVVASASFDAEGKLAQISGVTLDVSERKLTEQRQAMLAREVDHRARNALAVVQSIIRLTRANEIAGYVAAVEGRIRALAHVHDLLSQARWQGADISRLIAEEMAPYSEGDPARIEMTGLSFLVDASHAQTISLSLHELATNAAKYGALSQPQGRVQVAWSLQNGKLSITWRERGGPPVSPPARRGFGSKIITASVAAQRGGSADFQWKPEGLECELIVPMASGGLPVQTPMLARSESATARLPATLRILVVEDEPLIGMANCSLIEELGHSAVGPCVNIAASRTALTERLDAAILDVNLGDEEVYSIADELVGRGIPFVFMTGYGPDSLEARFRQYPILQKPIARDALAQAIEKLARPLRRVTPAA
jgi:two-component sensor histidine kinase/CheY-like chemotaxis protein